VILLKQLFTICLFVVVALSGCSPQEDDIGDLEKNFEGSYQELVIPTFATVVNTGTIRRATGNNFIRNRGNRGDRAIEVYPGSIYEPDLPEALKEGQIAEILLEEVNRHAEKPKEIYSIKTSNLEEANVKIPNEPGKLYRYTIKIKDANGTFKDIRYDPLFTTFEEYNMAINLMKPVYEKGEVVTFFIQNWGPNHISYSENWKVFKQTDENWEEVWPIPTSEGMMEPLLIEDAWTMKYLKMDDNSELLLPGKSESIVLSHYKFDKGTYKLQVTLGSAKHKFILEDGFVVK
jgi:hypothetical protein